MGLVMIKLKKILYEVNLPIKFDKNEISQISKSITLHNIEPYELYIASDNRYMEFTKHKNGFTISIIETERDENGKIVKDKIIKKQEKIKTIKDLVKTGKKYKQRYL